MPGPKDKIAEQGKLLFKKKAQKEKLEAQLKSLNKEIVEIETIKLPKLMEDAGVDSIGIKGCGTVYMKQELYVNVLAENRDKLYEWLAANKCGDMIKQWVFPNTLKSFCKQRIEENKALPPEEIVKATFIPTAATRRGK